MRSLYDLIIEHDDTKESHATRDRAIKAIKELLNSYRTLGHDIELDRETSNWLNEGEDE